MVDPKTQQSALIWCHSSPGCWLGMSQVTWADIMRKVSSCSSVMSSPFHASVSVASTTNRPMAWLRFHHYLWFSPTSSWKAFMWSSTRQPIRPSDSSTMWNLAPLPQQAEGLLDCLHSVHQNIQFTMEMERDSYPPFLDTDIYRRHTALRAIK
jgi:hypothetical protein